MKIIGSSFFAFRKTNIKHIVTNKTSLFNQFVNRNLTSITSNAMQDEYGRLDSTGTIYTAYDFELECGKHLVEAKVNNLLLVN